MKVDIDKIKKLYDDLNEKYGDLPDVIIIPVECIDSFKKKTEPPNQGILSPLKGILSPFMGIPVFTYRTGEEKARLVMEFTIKGKKIAVVDNTKTVCKECKGTGKIMLFNRLANCKKCN